MANRGSLTYADLAAMPGDNVRREIIGGELIVSPSPKTRHQVLLFRLTLAFGKYLETHGGGMAFFAPYDVLLSDRDVVEPDFVFVADAQSEIVTELHVRGVPALLVEIVSDPRMDRVRKRDLYARFGVPEYWIVDPDADRIEVYRHDGTGYPKPEILEPGDELTFALLPGLAVDLADLFARPKDR